MVTIQARQWHTCAVMRGDVSVRDGAKRCSSGLSAGQRWGTARGRSIDRNCTGERHESLAEERGQVWEDTGRHSGSGA
jgi:type IV secretory pathway TrbL component